MRSGEKETPPPCPSSCDSDARGAGADRRTHGRGRHFQHGGLYAEMALNGYVLHVDLSDIRELVILQRRCANNLHRVAIHVNTYGDVYPDEIKALQRDYADLWLRLSNTLRKLAEIVNE